MVHLRLIQLQMNTQVNVTKANINGVHPSSVLTFKSNLLLRNRSGNSGIVTFICFWYQIDLIHFDNISVSFITSSRKIECVKCFITFNLMPLVSAWPKSNFTTSVCPLVQAYAKSVELMISAFNNI